MEGGSGSVLKQHGCAVASKRTQSTDGQWVGLDDALDGVGHRRACVRARVCASISPCEHRPRPGGTCVHKGSMCMATGCMLAQEPLAPVACCWPARRATQGADPRAPTCMPQGRLQPPLQGPS